MLHRKVLGILAGALLLGVCATSAVQAEDRYIIDKDHSSLFFLISHAGFANLLVEFKDFAGSFTFDENAVESNTLVIKVVNSSIETHHQGRDDYLRSPDFFNVEEFPEMKFASTKIERTGERTGRVTGDLTLLGVTKPVTLEVTFNRVGPNPFPGYDERMTAGFSARGSLKRSDWGMTTFIPLIGDEISMFIEAEGYVEQSDSHQKETVSPPIVGY